MLRKIRSLVYKIFPGARRKDDLQYSPFNVTPVIWDGQRWTEAIAPWTWQMGNLSYMPLDIIPPQARRDSKDTLYEMATYCLVCRAKLEAIVLDIKQCPHGCGRITTGEGPDGLPIIIFEAGTPEEEE